MRKFILGTDWWDDCDDAVAMRLTARAVKAKEVQVLGIGINACMENSVASLKAFLLAEGIDSIPIGIDQSATDFGGNPPYQKRLAELMPNIKNSDAENAARLYRRLLAQANDPIEIMEIGYLQVISSVLQSKADDISEKSGLELFSEKVSKVWVMAGKWDADGEKENNFCRNMRSRIAGRDFCELCPVPVAFLGWEVGYGVITGNHLDNNDHLYTVLRDDLVTFLERANTNNKVVLIIVRNDKLCDICSPECIAANVNNRCGYRKLTANACVCKCIVENTL